MIDAEKEDNEVKEEEEEGCMQERGQYPNRLRKVQFVDAFSKECTKLNPRPLVRAVSWLSNLPVEASTAPTVAITSPTRHR
jgi:hypothetical protein